MASNVGMPQGSITAHHSSLSIVMIPWQKMVGLTSDVMVGYDKDLVGVF